MKAFAPQKQNIKIRWSEISFWILFLCFTENPSRFLIKKTLTPKWTRNFISCTLNPHLQLNEWTEQTHRKALSEFYYFRIILFSFKVALLSSNYWFDIEKQKNALRSIWIIKTFKERSKVGETETKGREENFALFLIWTQQD